MFGTLWRIYAEDLHDKKSDNISDIVNNLPLKSDQLQIPPEAPEADFSSYFHNCLSEYYVLLRMCTGILRKMDDDDHRFPGE